jgi:hypothetical protein
MVIIDTSPSNALRAVLLKGGKGSGNFDHKGRPGKVGGSGIGGQESDLKSRDNALNNSDTLKILKVPSKMYHVTERKNLENILRNGLQIKQERKSTSGVINGVYLTDSPDDVIQHQEDIVFEDPVTIVIDTKSLNLRLDPEYFYYDDISKDSVLEYITAINNDEEQYALYSKESIPISSISVLKR